MGGWSKGILELHFGPNLGLRLEAWTKLNNCNLRIFRSVQMLNHSPYYGENLCYTITHQRSTWGLGCRISPPRLHLQNLHQTPSLPWQSHHIPEMNNKVFLGLPWINKQLSEVADRDYCGQYDLTCDKGSQYAL